MEPACTLIITIGVNILHARIISFYFKYKINVKGSFSYDSL